MKKLLFLFPKINRYPRFKPLINLTNQLTEGGNIVYIAVIGKVDAKVKSHFKPEVIFLEHPSGINKFRLAVKVLRDDFDFFIGVQSHNSYWLALAKLFLLSDKKIISWEHTSPYNALRNEYPKHWYVHLIIKCFFSLFTNGFFCVSKGAVDEMIDKIKIPRKKVFYTPNLVFTSLPDNEKSLNENGKFIFLSVGRLSKEKGLDIALKALSEIKNLDWEYWIVGDGPDYNKLTEIVENSFDLKEKVTFFGRRENVDQFMQSADVLLLPSYFEGLPTVLVEASINSLPIIASNCKTGPSEIVVEGVNGFLTKVGDSRSFSSKIIKFLECKENLHNSPSFVSDFSNEAVNIFEKCLMEIK